MSKKEHWIWMPHAAHFILGDKCQFVMATYVGGGYIVSTVGELWNERSVREIHARIHDPEWHAANNHLKGDPYDHAYRKHFGFEDLGWNRKYETMVFKAVKADIKKCPACPYIIKNGSNIDSDGYTNAGDAYRGHLKMCEVWSKKNG